MPDPKSVKSARGVFAAVIGGFLALGLLMVAGYNTLIRPNAPRNPPPPPAEAPAPAPAAPAENEPIPAPPAAAPNVATPKSAPKGAPQAGPKAAPSAAPGPVKPSPVPVPAPPPKPAAPPPPDPAELISKGMKAFNDKQPEAALAFYKQARQAQPGNADLGYLMGVALEQTGNLGEALASFESCTSGNYAAVSRAHVKRLEKKLKRK